jgi:hypothetical protein
MNEVIELDECRGEISGGNYPSRVRSGKSNGGGGGMDDILKRLGAVESTVSEIRSQISGIAAILPHLATKADIRASETAIVKWIIGVIIAAAGLAFTIAKYIH